jgi:hypothetical protein
MSRPPFFLPSVLGVGLLVACEDVEEAGKEPGHSHGLVTRLGLRFIAEDTGEEVFAEWADPELDGDARIDDIVLHDAGTAADHAPRRYRLELEAWNDLEDPAEDVGAQILDLAEEHWLFFTGGAVEGPSTGANPDALFSLATLDTDADGLPLGMVNEVETLARGSGELEVVLRHLVPENGESTKVEGLDTLLAEEGLGALPGANDVQVVFSVTVEAGPSD